MRRTARIAGVFYLMDFAFAPALYAIRKFVVPGDAAATAANILAHETVFRLGFAGNSGTYMYGDSNCFLAYPVKRWHSNLIVKKAALVGRPDVLPSREGSFSGTF